MLGFQWEMLGVGWCGVEWSTYNENGLTAPPAMPLRRALSSSPEAPAPAPAPAPTTTAAAPDAPAPDGAA